MIALSVFTNIPPRSVTIRSTLLLLLKSPSGAFDLMWFFRKLGAVPNGHDPDGLFFRAVEKPIWGDDDFSKR
jgi:hypothetical protein